MRPALIIGAAECVNDDMQRLERMVGAPLDEVFTTFAVNDGGVIFTGRLDHWVTLHPDELPEREQRRRDAGGGDGYMTWSDKGNVDRIIHPDYRLDAGGGAFLAVGVSRELGHDRRVMVGCPFEGQPYAVPHLHHGTDPWPYFRTYQAALDVLVDRHPWIRGTMRSMSGYTMEVLGLPDREWLGLTAEHDDG